MPKITKRGRGRRRGRGTGDAGVTNSGGGRGAPTNHGGSIGTLCPRLGGSNWSL